MGWRVRSLLIVGVLLDVACADGPGGGQRDVPVPTNAAEVPPGTHGTSQTILDIHGGAAAGCATVPTLRVGDFPYTPLAAAARLVRTGDWISRTARSSESWRGVTGRHSRVHVQRRTPARRVTSRARSVPRTANDRDNPSGKQAERPLVHVKPAAPCNNSVRSEQGAPAVAS